MFSSQLFHHTPPRGASGGWPAPLEGVSNLATPGALNPRLGNSSSADLSSRLARAYEPSGYGYQHYGYESPKPDGEALAGYPYDSGAMGLCFNGVGYATPKESISSYAAPESYQRHSAPLPPHGHLDEHMFRDQVHYLETQMLLDDESPLYGPFFIRLSLLVKVPVHDAKVHLVVDLILTSMGLGDFLHHNQPVPESFIALLQTPLTTTVAATGTHPLAVYLNGLDENDAQTDAPRRRRDVPPVQLLLSIIHARPSPEPPSYEKASVLSRYAWCAQFGGSVFLSKFYDVTAGGEALMLIGLCLILVQQLTVGFLPGGLGGMDLLRLMGGPWDRSPVDASQRGTPLNGQSNRKGPVDPVEMVAPRGIWGSDVLGSPSRLRWSPFDHPRRPLDVGQMTPTPESRMSMALEDVSARAWGAPNNPGLSAGLTKLHEETQVCAQGLSLATPSESKPINLSKLSVSATAEVVSRMGSLSVAEGTVKPFGKSQSPRKVMNQRAARGGSQREADVVLKSSRASVPTVLSQSEAGLGTGGGAGVVLGETLVTAVNDHPIVLKKKKPLPDGTAYVAETGTGEKAVVPRATALLSKGGSLALRRALSTPPKVDTLPETADSIKPAVSLLASSSEAFRSLLEVIELEFAALFAQTFEVEHMRDTVEATPVPAPEVKKLRVKPKKEKPKPVSMKKDKLKAVVIPKDRELVTLLVKEKPNIGTLLEKTYMAVEKERESAARVETSGDQVEPVGVDVCDLLTTGVTQKPTRIGMELVASSEVREAAVVELEEPGQPTKPLPPMKPIRSEPPLASDEEQVFFEELVRDMVKDVELLERQSARAREEASRRVKDLTERVHAEAAKVRVDVMKTTDMAPANECLGGVSNGVPSGGPGAMGAQDREEEGHDDCEACAGSDETGPREGLVLEYTQLSVDLQAHIQRLRVEFKENDGDDASFIHPDLLFESELAPEEVPPGKKRCRRMS